MNSFMLYLHLALGLFLFAALAAGKLRAWHSATVTAAILLVITGAHNFMTRMPGAPRGWHAAIGIKILLALHVIAIVFLSARPAADAAKIARWRKGALISGGIVLAIGLYYSNFAR